jgi:hypothetical protein
MSRKAGSVCTTSQRASTSSRCPGLHNASANSNNTNSVVTKLSPALRSRYRSLMGCVALIQKSKEVESVGEDGLHDFFGWPLR